MDAALRHRPPASTEQVLHPQAYVAADEPRRVRARAAVAALGEGWRPVSAGTVGEWTTGQLLARAGGTGAADAADGWGGDRYVLLRRGGERALVARWTWDTPGDEREFATALRAWAGEGLPGSEPAGADAWRTPDGAAAIGVSDGAVTLALAPALETARAAALAD